MLKFELFTNFTLRSFYGFALLRLLFSGKHEIVLHKSNVIKKERTYPYCETL